MYIPELDALIFLATEFLEEDVDRPVLQAGITALHEAAGAVSDVKVGFTKVFRTGFADSAS